jgi:hypothetical protein
MASSPADARTRRHVNEGVNRRGLGPSNALEQGRVLPVVRSVPINVRPTNAEMFFDNFGAGDPIVVKNSSGGKFQNSATADPELSGASRKLN